MDGSLYRYRAFEREGGFMLWVMSKRDGWLEEARVGLTPEQVEQRVGDLEARRALPQPIPEPNVVAAARRFGRVECSRCGADLGRKRVAGARVSHGLCPAPCLGLELTDAGVA